MLKVYYCESCERFFFLSKPFPKEQDCKRCNGNLRFIDMEYADFVELSERERKEYVKRNKEAEK